MSGQQQSQVFDRTDLAIISELRQHVGQFDYLPPDVQRELIDQRKSKLPSPDDDPVQQRFRELAKAHNLDIGPQHAPWGESETALRDRLYSEAQTAVAATWPAIAANDIAVGDPAELLRDARQEHAKTLATLQRAEAACERAGTTLADVEAELRAFAGIDDQVSEWTAQQFRDGADSDELPWYLESGLRDRSRSLDRADHAKGALRRLDAERRQAEAAVALALKRLREAAAMVLYRDAEPLAAEIEVARRSWLALAERLAALPYALPDCGTPLPLGIVTAINRPLPTPERREALVDEWRAAHRRLMADGYLGVGDFD